MRPWFHAIHPGQGGINAAPVIARSVGDAFMRPWFHAIHPGQGGINTAPTVAPNPVAGVAFMRPLRIYAYRTV